MQAGALWLLTVVAFVAGAGNAHGADDYDIRQAQAKAEVARLDRVRPSVPARSARVLAMREDMQAARAGLEPRAGRWTVIENRETGGPEVVAPARGRRALTAPANGSRERIARDFVETHAALYGLRHDQAAALELDAEYLNPAGNLAWVRLQQRMHGRPVFGGEITVALTPGGEIVRTTGRLAAALDEREAARVPLVAAAHAVSIAAQGIGVALPPSALVVDAAMSVEGTVHFARGPFSDGIRAELVYFPLGEGSVDLAWSLVLWRRGSASWNIVGASSGELLWRKELARNALNSYLAYPENPAPLRPGPTDPTSGPQGARVAPTQIEVDSTVSTGDPWLAAGVAVTAGNNVIAGLDIDGVNGVDAPLAASAPGEFLYGSNPPPGLPPPGDGVSGTASRNAAIVNAFVLANRFHDRLYDLGFTEAARNFQQDNYARGSSPNDRVLAEVQDSSGTDNASFTTPQDGFSGRMQLFVYDGPTPARDSALDAGVVLHELAHGLSERLHANSAGLFSNMGGGLGEGWSDFYALSLLARPDDALHATVTVGDYVSYLAQPGYVGNYYYGFRRFPRAPRASLGANGKPHDPLTFADIDGSQADFSDGAHPPGPLPFGPVDEEHNMGEVWTGALWEARANVIGTLGPVAGNERMLQIVTDAMKLDVSSPTFLQARDTVLAADCAANDGASELDLWRGFATRGLGLNARITHTGSGLGNTRVMEDFSTPLPGDIDLDTGAITWTNSSCGTPVRNPAPGETVLLSIPLANPYCGSAATGVQLSIDGGAPIPGADVGPGDTATMTVPYTVPAQAACGAGVTAGISVQSSYGTQLLQVAVPVGEPPVDVVSFTQPAPITIPTLGAATPYPSTLEVSGIVDPLVGVRLTLNASTHKYASDLDVLLVGPGGQAFVPMSDALHGRTSATYTLALRDDAATPVPETADTGTGTGPLRPTDYARGAADAFPGPAPAGPYALPAPTGAATFASTFAGQSANGTWSLYVLDDEASDGGALSGGWTLDLLTARAPQCLPCLLSVGGSVGGLAAGNTVALRNNDSDEIVVAANGVFVFPTTLLRESPYAVSVAAQPSDPNQRCSVSNGSGTLTGPLVTNVAVQCVDVYTIGGSVSGLEPGASVSVQNNGGDTLVRSATGDFAFPYEIAQGSPYAVAISAQPDPLFGQTCEVFQGSGVVAGANVATVRVICGGEVVFSNGFD